MEKNTFIKKMLNFDTINLDDSIFKNDPDSEIANRKKEQNQVKPIAETSQWTTHQFF